jgi:tetratricopeptide (TPR) repeat protein
MHGGVREEHVPNADPARRPPARPGSVSQQRMPAASPPSAHDPSMRSRHASGSRYSSSSMDAIRDEQIRAPAAAKPARVVAQPSAPAARSPSGTALPVQPQPAVTSPSSHERRRRPRRKLGLTLQRLGRELQQLKQAVPAPAPTAAPDVSSAASTPQSQAKTHLEQLRRMRAASMVKRPATPQNVAPAPTDAASQFRAAQEALREQQFPRAYELMKKLCEAAPADERYALYREWAGFRAGALDDDGISKLRLRLREKVSDDQLKGFAYYALGHIAIHEKKDDAAAEKYFRKAVELDKNNKDAQRHLRIIELRQKTAAEEKSSKIFGIDLKKRPK